jgi:uncharacterized protein YgiM (DUF1202 family)
MADEQVQNPPSLSALLIKQWKWVGVALAVITLAIVSKSGDVSFDQLSKSDRCQVQVNADILNVRAGPGADTAQVEQLKQGDIVDAQPEVANGFRKLGDNRWVSDQFVKPNSHC